jgi:hypothetical protein
MAEIADDIVTGACCSWCGTYFCAEHGYPVVCNLCADGAGGIALPYELQRATLAELGAELGSARPDPTRRW